jgi:uncharacterized tellurite resistance protein B-like protein
MIQRLLNYLDSRRSARDTGSVERALRLSAAVLMVETMRADFTEAPEERDRIVTLVEDTYGLDRQEAEDLILLPRPRPTARSLCTSSRGD